MTTQRSKFPTGGILPFWMACLWAAAGCGFWFTMAQEPENPHFRTSRISGKSVVYVDNFRFKEHVLSFDASDHWIPIYFTGGLLVHFQHRTIERCAMAVRQDRLPAAVTNETDALKFYEAEIQKLKPCDCIKDSRPAEITVSNCFARRYLLAVSSNDPPTQMQTFFVQPPFLYTMSLNVPSRLTGTLRADFSAMVQSVRIQNLITNAPSSAVANAAPGATATPAPDPAAGVPAATNASPPVTSTPAPAPTPSDGAQ
ncbi:MAG: hypothetical protein HY360_04630 [Verrucomicrobia bacterium]|nr:hypothetical protein [Verrucomicrobiota bacterium]